MPKYVSISGPPDHKLCDGETFDKPWRFVHAELI